MSCLVGVVQWVERPPRHQGFTGEMPCQATRQEEGSIPRRGLAGGSHHRFSLIIDVSIPLALSLPVSDINKTNEGMDRNFRLRLFNSCSQISPCGGAGKPKLWLQTNRVQTHSLRGLRTGPAPAHKGIRRIQCDDTRSTEHSPEDRENGTWLFPCTALTLQRQRQTLTILVQRTEHRTVD